MLIGLGHKKGSGKSTVASILERDFGFKRMSFAKKLKESLENIFEFNKEQLYGKDKEKIDPYWGFSARDAMTKCGDGFRELMGQDLWCKAIEREIKSRLKKGQRIVIDDVRYRNEVDFIRSLGGVNWKIHRPKVSNLFETIFQSILTKFSHKSEVDLDDYTDWDRVILNDFSHSNLINKIHSIMKMEMEN